MSTTIRLQRTGRKKQASFRIVVSDRDESRDGPAIETLGTYNPRTQPSLIKLNTAAALNWLHQGAQPTDTVVSIFRKTGVWTKFQEGVTGDAVAEEDAIVELGPAIGERKTSRRAQAAAEGEQLAAARRAEEKAVAEAAAKKAAAEAEAAAKAEPEAEAEVEEAPEAEAEPEESIEAEAEEVPDADAEAQEAPEAESEEEPEAEAEAEKTPEAEAEEAPEAEADSADEDAEEK
ncbi:MAG: 30S ribosomal protein S16 [Gemmatimonadota bacterium]